MLSQIADGGGFITNSIFTNPTGAPISSRITFSRITEISWPVSLNGATAASSYTITAPDTAVVPLNPWDSPAVVGWAQTTNVLDLGVTAAFRLQLPGIPESASTVSGIDPTTASAWLSTKRPALTLTRNRERERFDTVIENLISTIRPASSFTRIPHIC